MMTKKLVAAAALLALAGGANAQMVIYGLMDVSYGQGLLDNITANGQNYYLKLRNRTQHGRKETQLPLGWRQLQQRRQLDLAHRLQGQL